jgi:hypothetical protein
MQRCLFPVTELMPVFEGGMMLEKNMVAESDAFTRVGNGAGLPFVPAQISALSAKG